MPHVILESDLLRPQLEGLANDLSVRYRCTFDDKAPDEAEQRKKVADAADDFFMGLQPGSRHGEFHARQIVTYLVCPAQQDDTFWASPVGRAVAWWIAPGDFVTSARAAAILNLTRQRVGQLTQAGRLGPAMRAKAALLPGEAVRDFMRERYPLEG